VVNKSAISPSLGFKKFSPILQKIARLECPVVRPVRLVWSEVSTLTDIQDTFRTCLERDRIDFFVGTGGQNTSKKNKDRGIFDFSQLPVCLRLSGIQNLSFVVKVGLQDFPDF